MQLAPDDAVAGSKTSEFGRRQVSENSMEYMIFVIDEKLDGISRLKRLNAINKEATHLMESIANRYIWQRDEFHLEVANALGLVHLHGRTDYGDAVEDEWLIVYVLRQLSKAHPDLFIRVADEDGEFLLVEAANVVPNWLNPEIDHCRVWIHGGRLKIIPFSDAKTSAKSLTLPEAIEFLKSSPDSLIQSPLIENEAFYRLEKYPQHAKASIHYSKITIPRRLAYIVHELPKTVSAAVETFYLRDHAGMKKMASKHEDLHLPPTDLVSVSVRFSRVLFAQLRSQRFEAPPSWRSIVQGYAENAGSRKESYTSLTGLEDGMKLTCGYEMLALTAEKSRNRSVRELAIMLEDLKEDGDQGLPTDVDMEKWPDVGRHDDEGWLDINYEDFERELEGKRSKPDGNDKAQRPGFGDAAAQENLHKIVARFESFLNNETAGLDGVEMNEMDHDNDDVGSGQDSDQDSDEDDEFEDKVVSFDEETFSRMMKEMMGLPPADAMPTAKTLAKDKASSKYGSDDDDDGDEMCNLSLQMEAELKEHGALCLDDAKSDRQDRLEETRQISCSKEGSSGRRRIPQDTGDESGDESSIGYNLAKNLLESFKSQGGAAGPTGNLLGLMGFQLPRDEDDGSEAKESKNQSLDR